MYKLPLAIFGSKDCRNSHSNRGYIFPSADLGLHPLHFDNIGKLRGYVLHNVLKASGLAVSVIRCGTLYSLGNLILSTHGRAKGISEGYIISPGVESLITFGAAFHYLI
jgi:hypothetical protein